ncbi:hypothetical protein NSA52_02845 [Clostridium sporogenes]|uniref:hypothetical protein n=1 Tax=Clostridium sporogenes TaxID=1509 RepID=UPI002149E7E9|nr:hypothetical protein [Clostridium sporogenes]MCR1973068.1 hypothetical protein [Clostridium sporogenes]
MWFFGVIIIILVIVWAVNSPSTFFIGLFIFIGLCIWGVTASNKKEEKQKNY